MRGILFYTVYKITNLINGKFYIGKHQTKNLDDGYMGSGKLINRAFKKYGIENFSKEILYIFDNELDMILKEEEMIIIDNKISYNLVPGGIKGPGWKYVNETGRNVYQRSEKQKELLRQQFKIINKNHLEKLKNNIQYKEEYYKKVSRGIKQFYKNGGIPPFKGKKHTEEFKNSRKGHVLQIGNRNSQFGTCWITNLITCEQKKTFKYDVLEMNWVHGRINMKLLKEKEITKEIYRQNLELKRQLKKENRIKEAYKYWKLFNESNCSSLREFVNKKIYPYSVVSLTKLFQYANIDYNNKI